MTYHGFHRRFVGPSIGLLAASVGLGYRPVAAEPPDAVVIPTQFDQGRFFAIPTTESGITLRMVADTGGGMFFFSDSADRLKLDVFGVSLDDYKGLACHFPTFATGKGIPAPQSKDGVIRVAPAPVRAGLSSLTTDVDGILGDSWFAERVWTFDFVENRILYYPDVAPQMPNGAFRFEFGLRKSESPGRTPSYPRIQATIEGETFNMLLATGAAIAMNADALEQIGGGPAIRGTSLISNSVLDRWKKDHPEWSVIPNAEQGSGEPMIEVPSIEIAGVSMGPVWFTQRSDANFRDYFSEWMDKPVEGAVGANALRGLRLTMDYPNRTAWLEKP